MWASFARDDAHESIRLSGWRASTIRAVSRWQGLCGRVALKMVLFPKAYFHGCLLLFCVLCDPFARRLLADRKSNWARTRMCLFYTTLHSAAMVKTKKDERGKSKHRTKSASGVVMLLSMVILQYSTRDSNGARCHIASIA